MNFYLIDDDQQVINIIENIIEDEKLGFIIGSSTDAEEALREITSRKPDIVIIDMLMPKKDGASIVTEVKSVHKDVKFIMISQISTKNIIAKAYDSGVEFFINKPINRIEVLNVIKNIIDKKALEDNFKLMANVFNQTQAPVPSTNKDPQVQVKKIFTKLGMLGEKGSDDILRILKYLDQNPAGKFQKISDICHEIDEKPKAMEQRIRRAINKGLSNLANIGIEDYMNDTFIQFSNTIYDFESVKAEMDYIRGNRKNGGKISIKKFIENLKVLSEE